MVKVHVFNGSPARIVPSEDALTAMADMLGYDVKTLRTSRSPMGYWVSHWSYRCAGEIVGRVESV